MIHIQFKQDYIYIYVYNDILKIKTKKNFGKTKHIPQILQLLFYVITILKKK